MTQTAESRPKPKLWRAKRAWAVGGVLAAVALVVAGAVTYGVVSSAVDYEAQSEKACVIAAKKAAVELAHLQFTDDVKVSGVAVRPDPEGGTAYLVGGTATASNDGLDLMYDFSCRALTNKSKTYGTIIESSYTL